MTIEKLKYILNEVLHKYFIKTKEYSSYEQALKDSTNGGYDNDNIASMVFEKALNKRRSNNYMPFNSSGFINLLYAITLASYYTKQITVVDHGGVDGLYYMGLRSVVPSNIKLNWIVIETPAMVKYLKQLESDELKFTTDVDEILKTTQIDVFHSSGTFQYIKDPQILLAKISELNIKYLVFNRQCLNLDNRDIISIQNSMLSWHGVQSKFGKFKDAWLKYPHTTMSKENFERPFKMNYDLLYSIEENSGRIVIRNTNFAGISYVYQRKLKV